MKSTSIMNAVLIGILIGIVFYSFAKNTWGFITLFPLFLACKLINNSKHNTKELEILLKERNSPLLVFVVGNDVYAVGDEYVGSIFAGVGIKPSPLYAVIASSFNPNYGAANSVFVQ